MTRSHQLLQRSHFLFISTTFLTTSSRIQHSHPPAAGMASHKGRQVSKRKMNQDKRRLLVTACYGSICSFSSELPEFHAFSQSAMREARYPHARPRTPRHEQTFRTRQRTAAPLSQHPYSTRVLLGRPPVSAALSIISTTLLVQKLCYNLTKTILIYFCLSVIS